MIVLKNMLDVDQQVKDPALRSFIVSMNDQLGEDLEAGEDLDFVSYFGGDLYVLENAMELNKVGLPSNWGKAAEDHKSIVDAAECFDIAEWICKGKYAMLLNITNNGGGDTCFIPWEIAKRSPNVQLSIRMTLNDQAETLEKVADAFDPAITRENANAWANAPTEELSDVRYEDQMDEAKDILQEIEERRENEDTSKKT